jgi:O-acetyl-ADP-ribose deacetylase (regulator of RNase III)
MEIKMEQQVIGQTTLELVQGDITLQETDAIVNAANTQLAPGGGVAGAIHRAAGPALWQECRRLGGCETGDAKLTSGYKLQARYVIHTVGPIYSGDPHDAEALQACYQNSLALADIHGLTSVAFPAISAGAFGYPVHIAAEISLTTVKAYLEQETGIQLVRFVLYSHTVYKAYRDAMTALR